VADLTASCTDIAPHSNLPTGRATINHRRKFGTRMIEEHQALYN
jgi:hypothetical protein